VDDCRLPDNVSLWNFGLSPAQSPDLQVPYKLPVHPSSGYGMIVQFVVCMVYQFAMR
jgi:hypothetical protein